MSTGQANDDNYTVNKKGDALWCTGESLLVRGNLDEKYIVKDIVNLQAKKQLQLFLIETDDLLERVFETSNDIPIMILDGGIKILKVNNAFLNLFEITDSPVSGSRIWELDHSFWNNEDVKTDLRKMIVNSEPIKNRRSTFYTKTGKTKTIRIDSKIIDKPLTGRKIFVILEEIPIDNLIS